MKIRLLRVITYTILALVILFASAKITSTKDNYYKLYIHKNIGVIYEGIRLVDSFKIELNTKLDSIIYKDNLKFKK